MLVMIFTPILFLYLLFFLIIFGAFSSRQKPTAKPPFWKIEKSFSKKSMRCL